MKNRIPVPVMLVVASLLSSCASTSGGGASSAGPAGFSAAYFDEATLVEVMGAKSCTSVRVYDARRTADDRTGTALAIAINAEGEELNGWFFDHRYKLYQALAGDGARVDALTRSGAVTACGYVREVRDSSYVAEFLVTEVAKLLAADGCNGVMVSPEDWRDGYYTMRMAAVTIRGGVAVELTSVPALRCSEPCPTFCGDRRNYVNSPG